MAGDWSEYQGRNRRRLGSSDEFRRWLEREHEELVVPEDEIVLECGGVGWSPEDERMPEPGEVCSRCRNEAKPDESARCGARCLKSSWDYMLLRQKEIAEAMERDEGTPGGK